MSAEAEKYLDDLSKANWGLRLVLEAISDSQKPVLYRSMESYFQHRIEKAIKSHDKKSSLEERFDKEPGTETYKRGYAIGFHEGYDVLESHLLNELKKDQ